MIDMDADAYMAAARGPDAARDFFVGRMVWFWSCEGKAFGAWWGCAGWVADALSPAPPSPCTPPPQPPTHHPAIPPWCRC